MIAYIIKSSLSLLIWFGLYWFLLRKEKFLIFNRFYLILSIVFSLIIPIITIPVNVQAAQNLDNIFSSINNLDLQKTDLSPVAANPELSQSFNNLELHPRINISEILIILYFTGLAVYLFRFLKNIYIIQRQAGVSDKISYCGYVIVLIDYKTNPYSFLNYIFISRHDYNNKTVAKIFLDHEVEHLRQYHSIDILFIEFIKVFYWFNPILILYNMAIRLNHEYLADDRVIHNILDLRTYTDSLLNFTLNNRTIPLASGLNHSHIKKRIKMITNSKSGNFQYGFKIATLTISMIAALLIVSTECSQKLSAQTKLNQFELMKHFIGTWKSESFGGSAMILEYTPFGDAIVGNAKIISQDTVFNMKKYFLGYDEKNDKIIISEIYSRTPTIDITACWFISKDIMKSVPYQYISNPENAPVTLKFEFKSPDKFVITSLQNNTSEEVSEWTREKK